MLVPIPFSQVSAHSKVFFVVLLKPYLTQAFSGWFYMEGGGGPAAFFSESKRLKLLQSNLVH